jgi:hypothetical protein
MKLIERTKPNTKSGYGATNRPSARGESRMRLFSLAPLGLLCVAGLAGCHSHFVEVTIVNQGPVMYVMEFDYPSASFGANMLDSGAKYHYRFKIQGSGALSLQYQDASGHTRTSEGPRVDLGEEGSLLVNIDARGAVTWTPTLTNRQ